MTIDSRSLYATVLGLKAPWEITDVELKQPPGEVHIRITESHGELTDLDYTVGAQPYFHEHLVRDALGRITQIDETVAGVSTSRTYGYDAAGRLASVSEAGNAAASRVWEYDSGQPGNGNRTRTTYGPGVAADTATYDEQDRLVRNGVAAYDWAAAGELLHRNRPGEVLTTTYDALGNLVSARLLPVITGGATGASPEITVSYQVDGQNRRVERRLTGPTGPRTQRWLYRDGLAVVAELDGTNAVVNRYVYGTQEHAPDVLLRAEGAYRVITDHLGSIRALVNTATGAVAQRIDYDAWGVETSNTAPALQALGYAGGLTDADTKFIRFGARDYDPGVGRWTAKDPIWFEGGDANLFNYSACSPMTKLDPTGTKVKWAHWGTVVNLTDKCLLVSGSSPDGKGQIEFWISPHTWLPNTPFEGDDIDALIINGRVIKIVGIAGLIVVYVLNDDGTIDVKYLPRADALLNPTFSMEEWAKITGGLRPPLVIPEACKCQAQGKR